MLKRLNLGTKIMATAIGSIVIPTVLILVFIQTRSTVMKGDVHSVVQRASESELDNIASGVYETLDQAVNGAIKLNCQTTALNAKEGVQHFYDQMAKGTISETEAKQMATAYLLSQKIGESGYIYVLSRDGKILIHPKNDLIGQDLTKHEFIRDQISAASSGYFEYRWKNPGEPAAREKSLAQEIFEPWGWIISASAYKEELARLTKREIEASLRETILKKRIGESGYVYVLGGKADNKGHYILSLQGKRDGENIWNAKDSDGNLFIQSIVEKALNLKPGEVATKRYPWKNKGENEARMKIAKIAYFAPWDWIIGASAYEDEIGVAASLLNDEINSMNLMIGIIALVLVFGGGLSSLFLAKSIANPITRISQSLNDGAVEVASAANQVASSSQQMAEGSAEQAASVEETSSSLEEMSSMTKQNADGAREVDSLMKAALEVVAHANGSMTDLTRSMQEIFRASEETSRIIKVIDEIAFQTNLLALNAAVEAARAGQAGAGFAVVADEVRNLALRSAEAARNTADLIQDTLKKVGEGAELVTRTNEAFSRVGESVKKVGALVGEIATASDEQAQGIDQLNTAMVEIDQVVQQNASIAQQSASAAEEMNAQAEQMRDHVTDLVRLVSANGTPATGVRKRSLGEPTPNEGWPKEPGRIEALPRPRRAGGTRLKKPMNPETFAPVEPCLAANLPADSWVAKGDLVRIDAQDEPDPLHGFPGADKAAHRPRGRSWKDDNRGPISRNRSVLPGYLHTHWPVPHHSSRTPAAGKPTARRL